MLSLKHETISSGISSKIDGEKEKKISKHQICWYIKD